ncbi:hypothetical protein [Pseudomonas capsici]|uniref:hypothetical protein n=1 Tax=Pseudomonas capsici TaxID=2810614 RepID=UPI0021F0E80E|nr:hypothetical protein [Pseudomonas capsici]MCV4282350.1 hypothetical protein [Pseudomonas capsici]
MLMIRRYHPEIPCSNQKTAEKYSWKITSLGGLLSIGCGALFYVPLTQGMALALTSLVFITAVYLGRDYRRCVNDLIKQISVLKLIWIFAPTWRFLMMTTILMGVAIGLTEWSFFAEYKRLLLTVIIPTAALDVYKILKGLFTTS